MDNSKLTCVTNSPFHEEQKWNSKTGRVSNNLRYLFNEMTFFAQVEAIKMFTSVECTQSEKIIPPNKENVWELFCIDEYKKIICVYEIQARYEP